MKDFQNMRIPDTPENRRKYNAFSGGRGTTMRYSKNARKQYAEDQADIQKKKDSEDKRRANNKAQRDSNTSGVAANKKAIAQNSAAPKPKPQGDQQIDSPKASPEISAAKQVVQNYQAGLKDGKTPWQQAQSNVNTSANFGNSQPASDDTPQTGSDQINQMKQTGQDFADKYKLDLINSGSTKPS